MLKRKLYYSLTQKLTQQSTVVLLGPRQVGKTTLAFQVAAAQPSVYLDLESPADRSKLAEPELYLRSHEDKLVILDEIHRVPELFQTLRGLIDEGRRKGKKTGRFLLLGSASMELMQQSGESLAGRITYAYLSPLGLLEIEDSQCIDTLWVRGGFPDSFLAQDEAVSFAWREDFIRTYLERDIPQFGLRIPAETLRRFWVMLAHAQGGLLNASNLAKGLGVKGQTVTRYIDLMVDLLLVRRLMPMHTNTGKRLVKSPKVYVRDSGILHTLLGLQNQEALLGHPIVGNSWEGFVIESLLQLLPGHITTGFYRTAAGAELDLVIDFSHKERWAIEIKRGLSPTLGKGFHHAHADLKPSRSFIIYSGNERYALAEQVEAIGLKEFIEKLAQQHL